MTTIKERKIEETINKESFLLQELEDLEKKGGEIQKLREQKIQELQKISKEQGKKFFYCSKCHGNCKGLEKGYFH